jgi:hypothetical protein
VFNENACSDVQGVINRAALWDSQIECYELAAQTPAVRLSKRNGNWQKTFGIA